MYADDPEAEKLAALPGMEELLAGYPYKQAYRESYRYLTIVPQAQMCNESIAHEAEGQLGYWLRAHEGERNNCFSKIQLVGQENI